MALPPDNPDAPDATNEAFLREVEDNLRREQMETFAKRYGKCETQPLPPKPKSEPTPPPKAEPAPNQNSRTTGTDLHVDPDLFKQMPIGRAVLDEPMRYRGRYVFIVDRPTEEAVFHVFAVRRLGEEEQN